MLPDEFIPLAHRTKIYYKVIRVMLQQAIEFVNKHNCDVSINIDVTDINNPRTQTFIFDSLKSSGRAKNIQFELLENEVINDYTSVIEFINKIKVLGASIGIDDLGKGHSNFDRLIRLPVDFVKIDRSIILYLLKDSQALKLTKEIVAMAHGNGLKVVAEYCESKEISDLAIELGVDYLQGHYLGEPCAEI
jgi:EAL domain-containing protein (putative c-di-GMP-specific phosphodiesterase class I)